MAGIKAPITDILNRLAQVQWKDAEGNISGLYARVWNNQLRDLKDGAVYEWPRPAAFVEIVSPANYEVIGLGFRSADIGVKIHLIHDFYNQDGTFEQDLEIFDLRDTVIAELSQYCPTACGPLNCVSEFQDTEHDNLYHYVCDFVCNFIDSRGSKYDPDFGDLEQYVNDQLEPEINVAVTGSIRPEDLTQEQEFLIIPQTN